MIVMLFGISYLSASVANWFVNVRLLRDDEKRRRMELERIFGVDFGGPGGRGLELV